ncbi:MAG: (d)CMP kinase [Rhodospirillaceae bacterium]|nr:(d)CMP kinase [Rhodospirillaceae bacterium]
MVIAVDGPAAAGKGTLARRIAGHLGFAYLDTGLLYRCVAAKLLRAGRDPEDAAAAEAAARSVRIEDLDAPDLRSEAVSQAASKVAAIPGVRGALLGLQRRFAAEPPPLREGGPRPPGVVMDGRDIGTVVCPEAPVKIFITASPEVRAARRAREIALETLGVNELIGERAERIYARVLQDMIERDARDAARAVAPLVPARDARVIDTSALDPDEAFAAALAYISEVGVADPA